MDKTLGSEATVGNSNPDGDEVIVCRPEDPRLARSNWSQTGGYEQSVGEPIFLVIGAQTADGACARLGARFGVEARELIAFRDEGVRHG